MTQYEVTVACLVHVPTHTAAGLQLGTLYAGNILPAGVPAEKVKAWLDGGFIRKVGEPEPEESGSGPEPTAPEKVTARSNRTDLLAYATTHGGMTSEEADVFTNKQLIEKFVTKGE